MNRIYSNFINSLNADETKVKYGNDIKNFMQYVNCNDYSRLLKIKIEQKIIDYILHLRNLKLSSSTIRTRVAAIYHFYSMNDVLLNKTKINKYKGEYRKVVKDRAYTHSEIHKLLDIADIRMKICILLMCSSGLRIGAIPDLKLKHLEKISSLYKIIVYENSNDEYYTFCTPECTDFIDEYIKYRERNGEKITKESYLIRNHFDDYNPIKARGITKSTIRETTAKLLVKSGTRLVGEVAMTHGFRKFANTQMIKSGLNLVAKELLLGHSVGLDESYYRPTQEDLLQEYMKAVDNLTINEENRLRKKVEILQIEKSQLELLALDVAMLKQRMKKSQ